MKGIGNDLIREARRRRGMTQAQLAELAGTTQSAIARLESGRTAPSFDDVIRLLRLMELDLDLMLVERDDSDWIEAKRLRGLDSSTLSDGLQQFTRTVADHQRQIRIRSTAAMTDFEPVPLLAVLVDHRVDFVVIGGYAATLHESPFITRDVDITPDRSRENLDRLSAALTDLDARVRTADEPMGHPFAHSGTSLGESSVWNLSTRFGDLDISFVPNGTEGYPDLIQHAESADIHGVEIRIASLADIIRSKQAANRPKDQRVLPTLREILASRNPRNAQD